MWTKSRTLLWVKEIWQEKDQNLTEVIPNEFYSWFINSFPFWMTQRATKSFGKSNRLGNMHLRTCEIQYRKRCRWLSDVTAYVSIFTVLWSPIRFELMEHTSHPPSPVSSFFSLRFSAFNWIRFMGLSNAHCAQCAQILFH